MIPNIEPGQKWRNLKNGNIYTVLLVSTHHRDGSEWVVYQNEDGDIYHRELIGVPDCFINRFVQE